MSWRYLGHPRRCWAFLGWRALLLHLPAALLLHIGMGMALEPLQLPIPLQLAIFLLNWLLWSGVCVAVMRHYHYPARKSGWLAVASLPAGLAIDGVGLWLWPLLLAAGILLIARPTPDAIALGWPQPEPGHEP